jgi:sortase family protein
VPPPPVSGAAVGNGVAVRVGVADGLGDAEWLVLGDGEGLALGDAEEPSLGVADALDEVVADEEEMPGESFGSLAAGADPEQAAIDAEASKAAVAQPAAVTRTPNAVCAVAARILIRPPHKPGSWRGVFRSLQDRRRRKGNRAMAYSSFAHYATRLGHPVEGAAKGTAGLAGQDWRRIAGLRVVMTWPETRYTALPPTKLIGLRARLAGMAGALLILGGTGAIVAAVAAQVHAPQPSRAAAGAMGPSSGYDRGPRVQRSLPVSIEIPAIGVKSKLLHLGVDSVGAIEVPSLNATPGEAAWYKYSATPGQIGVSVIEGHVDTYQGPAIFFRLGALRPGDVVDVTLADGITAIFRVSGVRQYLKSNFPAKTIYGTTRYAALRLITCGGAFDFATGHYLSSTVVFATLASARRDGRSQSDI